MNSEHKRLNSRAFTLMEALLAVALFAMAAGAIVQVCANCLIALDISDADADADAVRDQLVYAVSNISDYDALDDGIDVEAVDGETYKVTGYAKPTQIIDLFELEVVAQIGMKQWNYKTFVIRPNWYEQDNERADLLKDRKDFLEEKRRGWEAPQSK